MRTRYALGGSGKLSSGAETSNAPSAMPARTSWNEGGPAAGEPSSEGTISVTTLHARPCNSGTRFRGCLVVPAAKGSKDRRATSPEGNGRVCCPPPRRRDANEVPDSRPRGDLRCAHPDESRG